MQTESPGEWISAGCPEGQSEPLAPSRGAAVRQRREPRPARGLLTAASLARESKGSRLPCLLPGDSESNHPSPFISEPGFIWVGREL